MAAVVSGLKADVAQLEGAITEKSALLEINNLKHNDITRRHQNARRQISRTKSV